jgi:hypothetical protein
MKKTRTPEELEHKPFTVNLKNHIVSDLRKMEVHSKLTADEIIEKALLMFIATHSDYLGRHRT